MSVCPKALDVLVQLEGSGRWPDNSMAINKTKAAMALKIAEQLRLSFAMQTVVAEEAIDVLHEGFAIRMHINSTAGGANNEAAERHLICGAAHAGVIATVNLRFPAYGPATQVAKRWIAAHVIAALQRRGHRAFDGVSLLAPWCFRAPHVTRGGVRAVSRFTRVASLERLAAVRRPSCGGRRGRGSPRTRCKSSRKIWTNRTRLRCASGRRTILRETSGLELDPALWF